eukprot:CAMPEP_0175146780 /NCGR_PEP_ID=MMETSP0087-20121206/15579_1 /TAXON_ID=136419 /ORGANISM="Unknown Unknown, Strain D1" /LENGTH=71 /DNA_ID=CAMNT_0016431801 /DNA_START=143 /DNA_END=358 /DNA_ORIENTATION=-
MSQRRGEEKLEAAAAAAFCVIDLEKLDTKIKVGVPLALTVALATVFIKEVKLGTLLSVVAPDDEGDGNKGE